VIRLATAFVGAWTLLISASPPPPRVSLPLILGETLPETLSDFGFFTGPARALRPSQGVVPYQLNVPLFSDYAEKFRFVWIPPGQKAHYTSDGVFTFPIGTALIKSFGYRADFRAPQSDVRLIETRVLLRRANGWIALPYVWNADGSEAYLKRAGKRIDVQWTQADGTPRAISYAVPNANQCKGCHDLGGTLTPIGPKARNLNDGEQLNRWVRQGLLDRAPPSAPTVPKLSDAHAPLGKRARAYLDVNCAHCHNRLGPANSSGLWLDWGQPDGVTLGMGKRPTAAGRGSGDMEFAIDPGHPERSYLLYRMQSLDPGIAMPELGRATVHSEGVALITAWIKSLN
jgi:uncharacterized repeat protein (TIGR03806 family)